MLANTLSQRTRLIVMVMYIVAFCGVCYIAQGSYLPPADQSGLWFYAAIAALLLGGFIDQPFFTKPNDAMSNAVGAAIGIVPVAISPDKAIEGASIVRYVALAIIGIVILSSALSMWFVNSSKEWLKALSYVSARISGMLGAPRVLFSAVFAYALWAFHSDSVREVLVLGSAWAVMITGRPIENLIALMTAAGSLMSHSRTQFGGVIGRQLPSLILVRHEGARVVHSGDVLVIGGDDKSPEIAIALDHVGTAEGRWLRCAVMDVPRAHRIDWAKQAGFQRVVDDEVWHLGASPNPPLPETVGMDARTIIGLVAPDTDINQLRFEIVRSDLDIAEGDLVSVRIGTDQVLYQVLNGFTKEEVVEQKNTRGFISGRARKIGVWDDAEQRLGTVNWLPAPNAIVRCEKKQAADTNWRNIGHFPNTAYGVGLDPNTIVTHSTAVLGVLGSGKSFLACEIVERLAVAGIKCVVLDLSNQYAKELAPLCNAAADEADAEALQEIGRSGKEVYHRNSAQGGSIRQFKEELRKQFKLFLEDTGPRKVRVINPSVLDVWRQDGFLKDGVAPMAHLTPPEITRCVAETLLDVTSKMGMTDEARCCLVLEEAHSLVPEFNAIAQEADKKATNGTAKAILQGRKFGFGCLLVTQRTANVTKSILNQCNTVFALQVFDSTGMEFLKNYIGEDHSAILSALPARHAVSYGRGLSCSSPIVLRLNDRDKFLAISPMRQPVYGPEPNPNPEVQALLPADVHADGTASPPTVAEGADD